MCGITGFVGQGELSDLMRMNGALAHRGPDATGTHIAPKDYLFLAHSRLSILDLEGGKQPMSTPDQKLTIVFNGEIYNHNNLRKELEEAGFVFQSDHSDTEVLLIAYKAYGQDMLLKLNGMFSFVIFDSEKRQLFFARDRFGEKPFYYFQTANCFAFASELSALRRHPLCPQNQSELALQKFMGYGFIPAPLTIIKDCYKLPAGHTGLFDIVSGSLRIQSYWTYRIEPSDDAFSRSALTRKTDELESLLYQSVRDRMACDVPFGVLLSGGVDSSLVTAIAQKISPQPIKTFSIGFNEPSYDESCYSTQVAQLLNTEHHLTFFGIDELQKNIPAYLPYLDEPLGDASFLPTALVCEETKKKVTVALTGDGGDELFFGYDPFDAISPMRWLAPLLSGPLLKITQKLAGAIPKADTNMSLDFKIRRFLHGFEVSDYARFPTWMAPLTPQQISLIWGQNISDEEIYSEAHDVWNNNASANLFDKLGEYFTRIYLADDILMKADRASMRSALELRSPLLDYNVADFVRTLPTSFKYHNGQRKLILKQVAQRLLPGPIIKRKKKGFGIPLSAWMREITPPNSDNGLSQINALAVQKMRQEHINKENDYRFALWNDVVLQHYAKRKG